MTPPDTLEQASRDSHAPTPRPASDWTTADAAALYGLEGWAGGYFRVGRGGTLEVTPHGDAHDTAAKSIDLVELTEGLRQRGIGTPVLIRFPEIVEHRMRSIRAAFDRAIEQEQYQGGYTCVYPIKVNQQRHLAETIRDIAGSVGFGLEAGSKPELLAVLGLTERRGAMPIVCNGFKDDEYVETVILAHKLGRDITTVIEGRGELTRLLSHADRYGVRPQIGVRVKPAAIGGGRWAESAGERSKFGLHASEVLTALERLKDRGMADCLSLVHFHIGSQLCEMRHIKQAISELARFFCELRRLGAGVHTIDVGGGLAIDYDGSQSAWSSSADYSLDEYATDIVYRIKAACDDAGQPHPRIISESGRAMVAHSSVLVFDVLGRSSFCEDPGLEEIRTQMEGEKQASGEEVPQPIRDLVDAYELAADPEKLNEAAHDATQARDEAMSLFNLGYLSLPMRAAAEKLYWATSIRVLREAEAGGRPDLADELNDLPRQLADTYFGNLSIFQSLPDSWAIDQLFPVMPIQRLGERPTRRAVVADITCDSDGSIDRFACDDARDFKPTLELHDLDFDEEGAPETPYYLAVFLVGAYQEVLGDLHNLFGDSHVAHVSLDDEVGFGIDELIEGDRVSEVLGYVQYEPAQLREAIRREAELAVRQGRMNVAESRSLLSFYESGLEGYTYLE